MTLQIETIVCGPIQNNVYIVYDSDSKKALVIDPSFEPEKVVGYLREKDLTVEHILITHAHCDHFFGVPYLLEKISSIQTVLLHPQDSPLWNSGGGSLDFFGTRLDVSAPLQFITAGEKITFGNTSFEIRLVPGHTPGSVLYYFEETHSAFVGDVIFYHSIGRTDLGDGTQEELLESIRQQVITLPSKTILYPGHGQPTTVEEEARNNPFLN